jgi:hypothetical protein
MSRRRVQKIYVYGNGYKIEDDSIARGTSAHAAAAGKRTPDPYETNFSLDAKRRPVPDQGPATEVEVSASEERNSEEDTRNRDK